MGQFFKKIGNDLLLTFFVLPGLNSFDGIIGDDTLKELKALIDREKDLLVITPGVKLLLLAKKSFNVHSLINIDHSESINLALNALISEFSNIFEPISPGGAVNTVVRAEIRTNTQDPVYAKSYPYPANMRGVVEAQVEELFRDGIIRPSRPSL